MAKSEQLRRDYLDAMGIQVWVPRQGSSVRGGEEDPHPSAEDRHLRDGGELVYDTHNLAPSVDDSQISNSVPVVARDCAVPEMPEQRLFNNWDDLEARVSACTACALHKSRTQTVFGVGNREAEWMVIGEAPGEQEDLQGEPFVGRAGQLLTEMLFALGLARSQVYIANILKCRPPGNRDPQADEVAACENYLKQQIAWVKPRIILAVGRIAAQNLLKTATPIGKLRGIVHSYADTPLVVTYHPAYLLRSPLEKRKAWDDLCLASKIYREQG